MQKDKPVWIARTPQNESVNVKFTRQYCADAHRLLAEAGFAPKLYHADEDSTDILQMTVMQNVEANVPLSEVPTPYRPQVLDKVRQALTLLHDNYLSSVICVPQIF